MKIKIRTIFMTAFVLAMMCGMNVFAEGTIVYMFDIDDAEDAWNAMNTITIDMDDYRESEITQDSFDYAWYLEQHPDLAAVVSPDNREVIWSFYVNVGEPAGWYGRIALDWYLRKCFNFTAYAENNPDVALACGYDPQALLNHYLEHGMAEGRALVLYGDCPYDKVYAVVAEIIKPGMTDFEKVTAIHDWVCGHTTYDYDSYRAGKIPRSSSSVEGLFNTGKSVCAGYAETMEALMDAAGLKNELINGWVTNGASGGGSHAWNRVYIGNEWFYVDATWDDWDGMSYIGHDCCLISEERMDQIHNGNVSAWINRDGTVSYR